LLGGAIEKLIGQSNSVGVTGVEAVNREKDMTGAGVEIAPLDQIGRSKGG